MAMRLMSSVGFVCVLSMEDGRGSGDSHNMRTGQKYGTWTTDLDALTTVGNNFTIPSEDLLDNADSIPGDDLKKFCLRQEEHPEEGMHCSGSLEEVVSKYGNILDRVPAAQGLDGSFHTVVSSHEVVKEKKTALCHLVGGHMYTCHVLTITLHEVVTRVSDGSNRTLRVVCHIAAFNKPRGCHVLAPGDIIATRSTFPTLV